MDNLDIRLMVLGHRNRWLKIGLNLFNLRWLWYVLRMRVVRFRRYALFTRAGNGWKTTESGRSRTCRYENINKFPVPSRLGSIIGLGSTISLDTIVGDLRRNGCKRSWWLLYIRDVFTSLSCSWLLIFWFLLLYYSLLQRKVKWTELNRHLSINKRFRATGVLQHCWRCSCIKDGNQDHKARLSFNTSVTSLVHCGLCRVASFLRADYCSSLSRFYL